MKRRRPDDIAGEGGYGAASLRRPFTTSSSKWMLILISSLLMVIAEASQHHFNEWATSFNRVYASEEERMERYGHWLKAWERVERHKAEAATKGHAYSLGLNEFSDWSSEEHKLRLGFKLPFSWGDDDMLSYRPKTYNGEKSNPPVAVDWRHADSNPAGVIGVTSVKNQGICGACYSFATVASLEGLVAADQGVLNELSNEQLIDVSSNDDDDDDDDDHYNMVSSSDIILIYSCSLAKLQTV